MRLAARPIGGRVLSHGEFALFLELLDRGLHERPVSGEFKVEIEAEGIRFIVATQATTTIVSNPFGSLILPGLTVEANAE